ncbi:GTP-binding protein HflX [Azospirillum agricola]|uniref:HflX-like GTP-binding protein n=1 Tax=Azospirillum agricola TaxID=1720247 RepID=UPI001AE6A6CB|nr:GTPase HflX [Azospirillum agricola]MBP2230562.1 GTP-binding protein HflX [Azospirillum agricola]
MTLFSETDPTAPVARALVVTPILATDPPAPAAAARLDEAVRLTRGIGAAVLHAETVSLEQPKANSLFGRPGLERLGGLVEAFHADLLVIDHPLTALQQRTLERGCLVKVLDRCGLILEALGESQGAQGADAEARMQADLAILRFQRGRSVRCWSRPDKRWDGLGFQTASSGGIPGDALLESHRRLLTERIAGLKRGLADLRQRKARTRERRRAAGIPSVALVGYAGAGVSTLLARLSGRTSPGAAAVGASLPSGRAVDLVMGLPVLADLPHGAITAFAATLDAVREADLILHVRDAADPEQAARAMAVDTLLRDLGIDPVNDPRLLEVFTKADRLAGTARAALALRMLDGKAGESLPVSAATGMGMDDLASLIERRLDARAPVLDEKGPVPA